MTQAPPTNYSQNLAEPAISPSMMTRNSFDPRRSSPFERVESLPTVWQPNKHLLAVKQSGLFLQRAGSQNVFKSPTEVRQSINEKQNINLANSSKLTEITDKMISRGGVERISASSMFQSYDQSKQSTMPTSPTIKSPARYRWPSNR